MKGGIVEELKLVKQLRGSHTQSLWGRHRSHVLREAPPREADKNRRSTTVQLTSYQRNRLLLC